MTKSFPAATPSATIILTRPAAVGFEVYLLKRSARSRLMAGNYVFPGGMVDAIDGEAEKWLPHADMNVETISQHLGGGLDSREALAYGVAAIRETFEEAGVLLAHSNGSTSESLAQANRRREAGDFRPGWFHALISENAWCLELGRLNRWAHWVTPLEIKRRYDTRFFVADMPPDQTCLPDALETTHGIWVTPIEGLEANLSGRILLRPPTMVTLQALTKFNSHETLLREIANRPWGMPIQPRFIPLAEGGITIEPWDPEFEAEHIEIDPSRLGDKLLPVGADFSRVWQHQGVWRPVGV
ncbi:MAG: hypothetical protein RBT11_02385 [Desulfobacterales bacterium]|jgi:8-oxo-dGTP pyrophosphatase MutT (NUDIX family)|nr:hypothetical protein [Desulfobacterales bacterium]